MSVVKFLFDGSIELMQNFFNCCLPMAIDKRYYVSDQRLDGRVVVITGGNSGIGKETARDLVRRGAKVIIGCRDQIKAKQVVCEFENQMLDGQVDVKLLDLGCLDSVRKFAKEMADQEPVIDYLINNAGILGTDISAKTVDGFEIQFGTNHLGHFLLTLLLIDRLKASKSIARIVIVASEVYKIGKIDFDNLNLNEDNPSNCGCFPLSMYNRWALYSRSKLANILFARELAERLEKTNIRVYVVHPGVVKTDIGRNIACSNLTTALASPVMLTPELGAQTSLFCILEPHLEQESGFYYLNCRKEPLWKHASDKETARRLWDVSAEMVKLNKECNSIVRK